MKIITLTIKQLKDRIAKLKRKPKTCDNILQLKAYWKMLKTMNKGETIKVAITKR